MTYRQAQLEQIKANLEDRLNDLLRDFEYRHSFNNKTKHDLLIEKNMQQAITETRSLIKKCEEKIQELCYE